MIKQNITRDSEIKNRLTVTRGEVGGDKGGTEGRGFRNMYKGHMDNTKGGRIEGERWGWLGWGEVMWGKWRQLCLNNKKLI